MPRPRLTLAGTTMLVGLLSASACAGATTFTEAPGLGARADADSRVTLAIGESVTLDALAVELTLLDVTDDSRCPADATCVWAGDATVTLRVRPANGPAVVVALHTSRPEATMAAGLRLTLERLDPLPTAGQAVPGDRYRAAISLSN